MSANTFIKRLTQQETINFLLTNRIPRRLTTRFMGWFSKIENPFIRKLSLAVWARFTDGLNLQEAKKTEFRSLHDCFIRELKPGARAINQDASIIISPCDAVVGEYGEIRGTEVFQAKGFPYTLFDLLHDKELVEHYRDGVYVTLRLKSTMYHRFHAPCACHVSAINYISGDTWNVNPIALQRIERLYCKNERAVIKLELDNPTDSITLVPVAAILVASIKLHFLSQPLDLKYKGPNHIKCDATLSKGDEIGYFQHGSTIIVFASKGFSFCDNIMKGITIQVGQPLMTRPL